MTMHADKLWRSQLHDSLQATAQALGLVLADDDSRDWMLVTAVAIQRQVEGIAPPQWVVAPQGAGFRCTGCGALGQAPSDAHSCSPQDGLSERAHRYRVAFSEFREWSIRANRAERFSWAIISAGDDGVLVIEMTGCLEAYEAAMGRARELVRARHLRDSFSEQDIEAADAALREVLTGTDRFWLRWTAWRERAWASDDAGVA